MLCQIFGETVVDLTSLNVYSVKYCPRRKAMSDLSKLNQLLKSKTDVILKLTDPIAVQKLSEEIQKIKAEISRQQKLAWEEKNERLDWD